MKVWIWVSLIFLVLVVVFTLQNAEAVTLKLLFWELSLSQALMIFVVFAIGILVGWSLCSVQRLRRRRQ